MYHGDMAIYHISAVAAAIMIGSCAVPTMAQDDLLNVWVFTPSDVGHEQIEADGATLTLADGASVIAAGDSAALAFDGSSGWGQIRPAANTLPLEALTVCAWVQVDRPAEWGGIIGLIQDNGDAETGWLLGYRDDRFSLALSTAGADDGNGVLTYLAADQPYKQRHWHHVAGTYDGREMRLYVDGRLAGASTEQHGRILYPRQGKYVLGCYKDINEFHPLKGALQNVRVYDRALSEAEINVVMQSAPSMAGRDPVAAPLRIMVGPYLQNPTQTSMTVMFESDGPGVGTVRFGRSHPVDQSVSARSDGSIYEIRLDGLEPETPYFYKVVVKTKDGRSAESDEWTFKTAVRDDSPFAYAVVGDTRSNPGAVRKQADCIWKRRPDFILNVGDVVPTGSVRDQWARYFLNPSQQMFGRFPVLVAVGNHEQDHQNYYDYVSQPGKEDYYDFTFGNTQFFVVDTNHDYSEGSEQYEWLKKRLAESEATWKIVAHHHPAFTSDSNDYGDTYKGDSTHGDPRIQQSLVPLYETYNVDVVFQGHVHIYERTWPIRGGHVDQDHGVVYVTTGGGGAELEAFAPTRVWFTRRLFLGYEYCIVTTHAGTFEMRVYDFDDRLVDSMTLHK